MIGEDTRGRYQGPLVEALLVARTLAEAAHTAGVPYGTARRLWNDPEFQRDLAEARQETFDSVLGRVRGMATMALDCLEKSLRRGDANTARYLLDRALALHESDIEARLRKLEERTQ